MADFYILCKTTAGTLRLVNASRDEIEAVRIALKGKRLRTEKEYFREFVRVLCEITDIAWDDARSAVMFSMLSALCAREKCVAETLVSLSTAATADSPKMEKIETRCVDKKYRTSISN